MSEFPTPTLNPMFQTINPTQNPYYFQSFTSTFTITQDVKQKPKSKPTLLIAFPAKFQIHARFAMTLMNVVEELRKCQNEWNIRTHYILGKSNLSHARSIMVTEWYDDPKTQDDDGFFFIDTDHTFTAEDILRVIRQTGDLNAGIYCNRNRDPTCFPLAGGFGEQSENIPLKYAATGFLFFKKAALRKIHDWMRNVEGLDRLMICDFPNHVEGRTIPFFHAVIEPPRESDGKRFWLGEDFSFSYRAIQAGLKIRGCITYTLGHEIPYVVFNDKPRRSPACWAENTVAVYCGAQTLAETEILPQIRELAQTGVGVIVYCITENPGELEKGILMKRYEEFQPFDLYSHIFVVGAQAFSVLATLNDASKKYVVVNKPYDEMPKEFQRCLRVFFISEELLNQCGSQIPPQIKSHGSWSSVFN